MRHITINDLAKRLKLSVSTVSRALRDHPDISAGTKKAVELKTEPVIRYSAPEVSQALFKYKPNRSINGTG